MWLHNRYQRPQSTTQEEQWVYGMSSLCLCGFSHTAYTLHLSHNMSEK